MWETIVICLHYYRVHFKKTLTIARKLMHLTKFFYPRHKYVYRMRYIKRNNMNFPFQTNYNQIMSSITFYFTHRKWTVRVCSASGLWNAIVDSANNSHIINDTYRPLFASMPHRYRPFVPPPMRWTIAYA